MPKEKDVVEPDVFSTAVPLRGTFFTADGTTASGLFRDPNACDRWTYEHFQNGNYALPLWERAAVTGTGVLAGETGEISWRLRERLEARGLSRDFKKGAYGCIAQNGAGHFFPVYCFDTEQDARSFAEEQGGRWIIAIMIDWVSMY